MSIKSYPLCEASIRQVNYFDCVCRQHCVEVRKLKTRLVVEIKIMDLGPLKYFIGIRLLNPRKGSSSCK